MDGKPSEVADEIKRDLLNHQSVPPIERFKRNYTQPSKRKPVARKPGPKKDDAKSPTDSKPFGNTTTGYVPPWWKGEHAAYQQAKKAMGGISGLPKMKK